MLNPFNYFTKRIRTAGCALRQTGIGMLAILAAAATALNAAEPADPGSDSFVTARLLIATPGKAVYQAVGHAALWMQCPSHGLDIVFSFETDLNGGLAGQFSGKAHGKMLAIDPGEYLNQFKEEGRGVTAYRLNLSPKEKRELWRALDLMTNDGEGPFNPRHRGCMSQALRAISQSVFPALVQSAPTALRALPNGTYADSIIAPHAPWSNLIIKVATASDCDMSDGLVTRLWPVAFEREYGNIFIVSSDGSRRPLVSGAPELLVEQTAPDLPSPVTPVGAAVCFAMLCAAACALQLSGKWHVAVRAIDCVLLAVVTAVGCAILFITYIPNHIGGDWNWNLLVMNPLPAVIWIFFRKSRNFRRIYLLYAAVLTFFIVVMPWLTTGSDKAFYIAAAALLVRCVVKYARKN